MDAELLLIQNAIGRSVSFSWTMRNLFSPSSGISNSSQQFPKSDVISHRTKVRKEKNNLPWAPEWSCCWRRPVIWRFFQQSCHDVKWPMIWSNQWMTPILMRLDGSYYAPLKRRRLKRRRTGSGLSYQASRCDEIQRGGLLPFYNMHMLFEKSHILVIYSWINELE